METKPENNKKTLIILLIILVFFLTLSCLYVKAAFDATHAGANKEQTIDFLTGHLPWEWHQVLSVTPDPEKDQILTGEQPNTKPALYIVYRFECPDCEKAYPYIEEKIAHLSPTQRKNVWWVPSRTEAGKKFLKQHPIELVPSSVLRLKTGSRIDVLYDDNTKETDHNTIDEVFEEFTQNLKEE